MATGGFCSRTQRDRGGVIVNDEMFLKPGHFLGVAFQEGPVFFRITGREIMSYEPYEVGAVQAGNTSGWFVPQDDRGNRILEPEREKYILHSYVGVAPEEAEVYLNFPPRVARFSLIGTRQVPGKTKWIDGVNSPFEEPNERGELISFVDLYPEFNVANPSSRDIYAMLDFEIAKYDFRIITDRDLVEKLIEGTKKCKFYTFLQPYQMPDWLSRIVNTEGILDYSVKLWKKYMGVSS